MGVVPSQGPRARAAVRRPRPSYTQALAQRLACLRLIGMERPAVTEYRVLVPKAGICARCKGPLTSNECRIVKGLGYVCLRPRCA